MSSPEQPSGARQRRILIWGVGALVVVALALGANTLLNTGEDDPGTPTPSALASAANTTHTSPSLAPSPSESEPVGTQDPETGLYIEKIQIKYDPDMSAEALCNAVFDRLDYMDNGLSTKEMVDAMVNSPQSKEDFVADKVAADIDLFASNLFVSDYTKNPVLVRMLDGAKVSATNTLSNYIGSSDGYHDTLFRTWHTINTSGEVAPLDGDKNKGLVLSGCNTTFHSNLSEVTSGDIKDPREGEQGNWNITLINQSGLGKISEVSATSVQ